MPSIDAGKASQGPVGDGPLPHEHSTGIGRRRPDRIDDRGRVVSADLADVAQA